MLIKEIFEDTGLCHQSSLVAMASLTSQRPEKIIRSLTVILSLLCFFGNWMAVSLHWVMGLAGLVGVDTTDCPQGKKDQWSQVNCENAFLVNSPKPLKVNQNLFAFYSPLITKFLYLLLRKISTSTSAVLSLHLLPVIIT